MKFRNLLFFAAASPLLFAADPTVTKTPSPNFAITNVNSITAAATPSPSAFTVSPGTAMPFISTGSLNGFNVAAGVTPVSELEVDSTTTGAARGITLAQYSTGTDSALFSGTKARGTRAAPTIVVTGDNITRWTGKAYDGSTFLESVSIRFGTTGTIAATRVPSFIAFLTNTDAAPSVLTEAMRITPLQNLLIGGTTDITGSGGIKVFGTTAATTTTSGSLQNAGGFGNAGDFYLGGNQVMASAKTISFGSTANQDKIYVFSNQYGLGIDTNDLVAFTNTAQGISFKYGAGGTQYNGTRMARLTASAFTIDATTASTNTTSGALQVGGGVGIGGAVYSGGGYFNTTNARINTTTATYGAGTAYALTATPAAIDLGTTDPAVTIAATGTYTIRGGVQLFYNAATFAANQTVTLTFRRTNNTPADLTNGTIATTTQIITALTYTYGVMPMPSITYAATSGDIITIFASVSVTPGAGSLDAVASGTWITAQLEQ